MNFNYFYKNNSDEFKEIKKRIWHFNNAIPPLPKKEHIIAKCFKDAFISESQYDGVEAAISKCKDCDSIVEIYVETENMLTALIFTIQNNIYIEDNDNYFCVNCFNENDVDSDFYDENFSNEEFYCCRCSHISNEIGEECDICHETFCRTCVTKSEYKFKKKLMSCEWGCGYHGYEFFCDNCK